ncbi:hypothetical protein DPMN_071756 [Dreissena polymorpha]|uniref:Cadherin domain-containing protein n=1 Tax=Dreissena polymorpha TaxID=45954 RepID=A0A9D3Z840_DREPO|nr:hypothetical protein DPMN_071756 [Dreissena polymorpha]
MEGLKAEKAFTFNILNKNEPPVSVKLEPNHIPENSAPGTVVGCLHGVDDDPTHKVNFLLVSSEMAFKLFPDGNRTCVKYDLEHSDPRCASEGGTHCALNLERNAVHNITVMASDGGTPPLSAYFDVHIYLTDANDMQTGVTVSPEEIPEEVTPGTQLLKMITIDEDVNQTYVYKLLDDMSGLFSLKGDILTANRTFDYETESSAVFTITENSPEGTLVGELSTEDPDNVKDTKQTFTYTLPDDARGRFKIDGNKLLVCIYVLDEKEKPVFAVKYDSISIAENTAVSIPASIFEVSDPDRGAKLTAHLVDPSEMFIFSDLVCTTVVCTR